MDSDLNALLDDALSDFDKLATKKKTKEENTKETASTSASAGLPSGGTASLQPPTDVFKEFFDDDTSKHLQAEWHQAIKELSEENPELMKEMKKMSVSPGNVEKPSPAKPANAPKPDFSETMKTALESLSLDADQQDNDDELINGLLNFGGGGGDAGNPMDMMENLMKTMLSKEMLYPPMKEMCSRYPDWLEKNSSGLPESEKTRFTQQLRCLNSVCKDFEDESPTDSENVKKQRFARIMDVIHEMQTYGQPPEDLIAGGNPMPQPDSCCIS